MTSVFIYTKYKLHSDFWKKDKTASMPFCRWSMGICDAGAGVLYRLVVWDEAKLHLSS
jgi:hypothetical protein